jgi:hypothetical protein
MFVGVLPAIFPMVAALYALALLAIPLAIMSPFLLIASIGLLAFGLALIPLGIAMSMFSVDAALGFAIAMGVVTAAIIPLAILSMFGFMTAAAVGMVTIAVGILALGLAVMIIGGVADTLASIVGLLVLLGLVGPLLVVAAIGIYLISGALIAFGLANVIAAGLMAAAAAINLISAFFGGQTPLEMLLTLASHADELYIAGKGIMFMAMGIGMLAKSLKDLDADALTEIGESMRGILPGIVGGDMNFVAGNMVMGEQEKDGAEGMAADNAEASALGRSGMMVNAPANTMILGGGAGGGKSKEESSPKGLDGQQAGGRMNESTFRRIQERFYKSAIV